jgi:hypothetical protein
MTEDGIVENAPPAIVFGDHTHITLRYIGRDVEGGSIAVDDLLATLNGFSSAFDKLAKRESLDYKPRIRVTGLSKSSANVHVEISEWAPSDRPMAKGIGCVASLAANPARGNRKGTCQEINGYRNRADSQCRER